MVLPRVEHGSFALERGVARAEHGESWIARYFLADRESVKRGSDLGQGLLLVGAQRRRGVPPQAIP